MGTSTVDDEATLEVSGTTACVICAAPTAEVEACCSSRCALEADREVRRNAARLQRPSGWDAPAETRRRLAERNGRLSSALLRWRPEVLDVAAVERCPAADVAATLPVGHVDDAEACADAAGALAPVAI